MGSLKISNGEKVYIDASILIYLVERHTRYSALLQPLLDTAAEHSIQLMTSELTVLETLILPLRAKNDALVRRYEEALFESELTLALINREIILEAARLRAQHVSLRTPDAVHWATMRLNHADYFLTNDSRLAQMIGTPALYLDSL
ncbi:MAG: PIN domain-containing protein [Fimbriimonadia bacterium]|nr:PIN domain-containing protein [Fimbriimonadia bacterium]